MEEALLDSVEDLVVLSLVDLVGVSDLDSFFDSVVESELEDELSLEPFLFSAGGLGRP